MWKMFSGSGLVLNSLGIHIKFFLPLSLCKWSCMHACRSYILKLASSRPFFLFLESGVETETEIILLTLEGFEGLVF
jgi:hypothetical protein